MNLSVQSGNIPRVSQHRSSPGSITSAVTAAQPISIHFLLLFFSLLTTSTEHKDQTQQQAAGTIHFTAVRKHLSEDPSCTALLPCNPSHKHTSVWVPAHMYVNHLCSFLCSAFTSAAQSWGAFCFCQNTYWHSCAPGTSLMTASTFLISFLVQ